ncbi:hypothetical protein VHTUMSATKI_10340 [Vibrio harveyi]
MIAKLTTGKAIMPTPTKVLGSRSAAANNKPKNNAILRKPIKSRAGSSDNLGIVGFKINRMKPAGRALHTASAKGDQPTNSDETTA